MGEPTLIVEDGGARLETFVHAALPRLSRRLVRRVIAEGAVRVNGRPADKGHRLRRGDRVTVPALPARPVAEPALALPVVHEDGSLVAVDKPGGMPGHALDPRERGTAAGFLLARYPEMAEVGDPLAPGLVHRLDTGTSGLLLAARTREAWTAVRAALAARRIEKQYLAIVAGRFPRAVRLVDVPLAHDPRDRRRMTAAPPGARAWAAETRLEGLGTADDRSLVRACIRTGVTHQVRVHLALVGHPVLGDVRYGAPPGPFADGRHALHATRIALTHPASGSSLVLECELPPALRALVP